MRARVNLSGRVNQGQGDPSEEDGWHVRVADGSVFLLPISKECRARSATATRIVPVEHVALHDDVSRDAANVTDLEDRRR